MNEYKLNVQPGKVVKDTYTVQFEKIADACAPAVNGEFTAPYVANVNLQLGNERVKVSSNGQFNAKYSMRGNNTVKKLGNLAKLLYKITISECGAILSNTKESVVKYDGLPKEATQAVKDAEEKFNAALELYHNTLSIPSKSTIWTKRDVHIVTPTAVKVDTQTIDAKLNL